MPVQIETFLTAYYPKSICLSCLATVTDRTQDEARNTVMTLLAERRAESEIAECLNCNATKFVARRRRTIS
jgi:hypothetical protein